MQKLTARGWLALGLTAGLLIVGCGLLDVGDEDIRQNSAPETVLTAAPPDTFDHVAHFFWKGEDSDGVIIYYETSVDGGDWMRTTATDTLITFSVLDDAIHTFAVKATDDDNATDDTPAEVTFTATSIAPNTCFTDNGAPTQFGLIQYGATVGPALTFELDAEDPDDKVFQWRYQLDGADEGGWCEWQADSVFAFADTGIIQGALGILPLGAHVFYGQARDASGLVDPSPVSFDFIVSEGVAPVISISRYQLNSRSLYADYSGFTDPDMLNDLHFEASANADEYYGVLGGFTYLWSKADEIDQAEFVEWTYDNFFDIANVAPGQYWFIVKVRDTAGTETADSAYVDIVDPGTEIDPNAILVIHETRNGTGRPGSPTSEQVVEYYTTIMGDHTYDQVVYTDLTAGGIYVTPGVAARYGTVIWVDDDASEHFLSAQGHEENMRFLDDYASLKSTYGLSSPTHLVLSTWNLYLEPNLDTAQMRDMFGLTIGDTNEQEKSFLLGRGQGPLAGQDIQVDAEKLPGSFDGMLNKCWTLGEPEGSTVLTTWVSGVPDTLDGGTNAYFYAGEDMEVVITGYPLFFMLDANVFMDKALEQFGF